MSDKKTILIVDDEPDILNLTQRFLKTENYKIITSSNGKEALKIIENKYSNIDLILLDVMMPGQSGFEVLRILKNNENFRKILVILFTVKSFKEDIEKGKTLGADGYITKPFSGKELITYVKEILN